MYFALTHWHTTELFLSWLTLGCGVWWRFSVSYWSDCSCWISSNEIGWRDLDDLQMGDMKTVNSLALGKFEWNFKYVIFKQILVNHGWGISSEIALIWMSLDLTDYQSTLVQVMAWCRQTTSHYPNQCWPRSLSPYGVTRSQRVNTADIIFRLLASLLPYCANPLILILLAKKY